MAEGEAEGLDRRPRIGGRGGSRLDDYTSIRHSVPGREVSGLGIGGQEIVLLLPLLWLWFTGTLLVIYVAKQKNRTGLGWGLLSLLIVGPLFALIALAAVPTRANDEHEEPAEDEIAARIRRM